MIELITHERIVEAGYVLTSTLIANGRPVGKQRPRTFTKGKGGRPERTPEDGGVFRGAPKPVIFE